MRHGIGSSLEHTKQNRHELVKNESSSQAKVESDSNNNNNRRTKWINYLQWADWVLVNMIHKYALKKSQLSTQSQSELTLNRRLGSNASSLPKSFVSATLSDAQLWRVAVTVVAVAVAAVLLLLVVVAVAVTSVRGMSSHGTVWHR